MRGRQNRWSIVRYLVREDVLIDIATAMAFGFMIVIGDHAMEEQNSARCAVVIGDNLQTNDSNVLVTSEGSQPLFYIGPRLEDRIARAEREQLHKMGYGKLIPKIIGELPAYVLLWNTNCGKLAS